MHRMWVLHELLLLSTTNLPEQMLPSVSHTDSAATAAACCPHPVSADTMKTSTVALGLVALLALLAAVTPATACNLDRQCNGACCQPSETCLHNAICFKPKGCTPSNKFTGTAQSCQQPFQYFAPGCYGQSAQGGCSNLFV